MPSTILGSLRLSVFVQSPCHHLEMISMNTSIKPDMTPASTTQPKKFPPVMYTQKIKAIEEIPAEIHCGPLPFSRVAQARKTKVSTRKINGQTTVIQKSPPCVRTMV